MLTLTLTQLEQSLPGWVKARLNVALIGPPGVGKTYNAVEISRAMGLKVEVLDGGQENEWKGLFPYRTPTNGILLGRALLADGGVLVIDEFNRVPPELKAPFQYLASKREVPWPDGGARPVDLAIIATANPMDLGVEEASRAELDRYDLIVELKPTMEEVIDILVNKTRGLSISPEAGAVVYKAVVELAAKMDKKKFHEPEGIRLAISVAKVLFTGMGPANVFRGAAERCFPMGRRGAEKYRPEFDALVTEVANAFAGRIANLGDITGDGSVAAPVLQQNAGVNTLRELQQLVAGNLDSQITAPAIPLPARFTQKLPVFQQAFGAGVPLHLLKNNKPGTAAERAGIKVHFGIGEDSDRIEFRDAPRHAVETFLQLMLS